MHVAGSYPVFHQPLPPGPSPQHCSQARYPPVCTDTGGCTNPVQVQDLATGLVELHEVHTGPLLKLVRSLWVASHLSSVSATHLGIICKSDEGAFPKSHCLPLMKVLNSVGSRMDLRGIVLVTGFHLDFELLTVTLWTGSSIQFVIYLTAHPSNQYCSNEVVGILWGTVAKTLQESMYMTSIALCLFTDAVTPFYKAIRLVRHSLLLKKPCFLSLITLSTICLDTDSRRICFIILGTVVPRVLLFKKGVQYFLSSSLCGFI